jgi:hypothetical protein
LEHAIAQTTSSPRRTGARYYGASGLVAHIPRAETRRGR